MAQVSLIDSLFYQWPVLNTLVPFLDANSKFALSQTSKFHNEIVWKLVDPAAKDNYAVFYAAENGKTECLQRLLLDPRVDLNSLFNEARVDVQDFKHTECLKIILSDSRRVDWDERVLYDLIFNSIVNDNVENLKILMEDSQFDFEKCEKNLPILAAVDNTSIKCLKFLLTLPWIDPFDGHGLAIDIAISSVASSEALKILLEDERFDPSYIEREVLEDAHYYLPREKVGKCVEVLRADSRINPALLDGITGYTPVPRRF